MTRRTSTFARPLPLDGVAGVVPAPKRGEKGDKGEPGERGPIGKQGPQGPPGDPGPRGLQGPTGLAGPPGTRGPEGPPGKSITGPRGERGIPGTNGIDGERGPTGSTGPAGQSIRGDQGERGIQGTRGPTGPEGIQGVRGDPGPKGDRGVGAPIIWRGQVQALLSTAVTEIPVRWQPLPSLDYSVFVTPVTTLEGIADLTVGVLDGSLGSGGCVLLVRIGSSTLPTPLAVTFLVTVIA